MEAREQELPRGASSELTTRNLRTVLALAALFIVPVAGSFWLYYGTGWRPGGRVNHGELIEPARPLPAVRLPIAGSSAGRELPADLGNPNATTAPATGASSPTGSTSTAADGRTLAPNVFAKRWALVYVGNGGCDRSCEYSLYVMRQTRLALGNDMARVERVFLATADCCNTDYLSRAYPGLIVLDASAGAARKLLDQFPSADRGAMIFVVDPLGNLMMRYDSRRDPKGLLQDLQRLLRLSHIG